jgi:hypothetical protein
VTVDEALQAALEAEHQAIYGYGVVGGRTSGLPRQLAAQCLDAHRLRRDALVGDLQARRVTPTPAAPGYELPFPVGDRASAARLAVSLENATAGVTWDLVAASASDSSARRDAVRWLTLTTGRLSEWQVLAGDETVVALPGQPA